MQRIDRNYYHIVNIKLPEPVCSRSNLITIPDTRQALSSCERKSAALTHLKRMPMRPAAPERAFSEKGAVAAL